KMSTIVYKQYSCDHVELLKERSVQVTDDIEQFLYKSMPISTAVKAENTTINLSKQSKSKHQDKDKSKLNDFFSKAFGVNITDEKVKYPSIKEIFRNATSDLFEKPVQDDLKKKESSRQQMK
ncbi:unnamed protein product, partial [Didymodactylos carnosus]